MGEPSLIATPDLQRCGLLGGTGTLSHLIRRLCYAHPLPAYSAADLPNGAHRCAVGGSFERPCAAKKRPAPDRPVWMQTSGAALLAVERCSLVRAWMAARDSCWG